MGSKPQQSRGTGIFKDFPDCTASVAVSYTHLSQQHPEKHIERFAFMMNRCDEREIEFALQMIEQILRGQEDYLSE